MATYYVDLEGGNDSNNGTTFALRKKSLSGITASAGDEIRVMASPEATSLGQSATWTNRAITSASINSSTNATPISITTVSAHGFSTGDTVCITGHSTNTNANGTWKITVTGSTTFTLNTSVGTATGGLTGTIYNITGKTVELTSAVTQTIASTGGSGVAGGNRAAWTGVTNVTVTTQSAAGTSKESSLTDQFAVNATFTTGKIAYRTLASTLNLSSYQQVSFWIQQTSGTLATDGNLRLRLCSDSLGDTVVNTLNVPAITAVNTWYPVTVDNGSALGSSINSVSLALTSDQGAQTFRIANIIACKAPSAADSLTLNSLIGKNDGMWYGIQSIDGTRVILDTHSGASPTSAVNSQRKYCGTTETVTTYKKETAVITATQTNTSAGTAGNFVTISGGWNRTDMSTQTDETIVDGQYRQQPLSFTANYQSVNGFSIVRGNLSGGLLITSTTGSEFDINFINTCAGDAVVMSGTAIKNTVTVANIEMTGAFGLSSTVNTKSTTYGFDRICGVIQDGIKSLDQGARFSTIGTVDSCNNGINIAGVNNTIGTITEIKNCITSAINFGGGSVYYNNIRIENLGTLTNNGSYAFHNVGYGVIYVANGSTTGHTAYVVLKVGTNPIYFRSVDFNESSSIWFIRSATLAECQIYMEDNNGVDYIFGELGSIQTDTTTRHTASGKSWALKPTSNTGRTESYPMRLKVARAAVAASSLVTVSAWVNRSNTAISARLYVAGGQVPGVNETFVDASGTANTWEQISLTFTPSAAGVLEIEFLAWGGTTNTAWIDDISITQA